jgi:3-mercaptopyruvate sulfurtransferase SseA
MRSLTAVLAVSLFTAGLANGQMKTPQMNTPPVAAPSPIVATPVMQPEAPLESAKRIKRDEAMKLVKEGKAVYVDVRSKESYDASHIKGAISIPLADIVTRVKEIPPGKMIIAYCA